MGEGAGCGLVNCCSVDVPKIDAKLDTDTAPVSHMPRNDRRDGGRDVCLPVTTGFTTCVGDLTSSIRTDLITEAAIATSTYTKHTAVAGSTPIPPTSAKLGKLTPLLSLPPRSPRGRPGVLAHSPHLPGAEGAWLLLPRGDKHSCDLTSL